MASSSEIEKRIRELENLLQVKRVDWGGIYDDVCLMEMSIGCPDEEEFEKAFVERMGSRDEFIEKKEKEWRAKNVSLLDLLQAK